MGIYGLLAEAFTYPHPALLAELQTGVATLNRRHPAYDGLATFCKRIARLSVEEWEELATRTLDLSPAAAPYVGFQIWGDSYPRGGFMSRLNRAMYELDIDPAGELPDHVVPVLRYLDVAEAPLPELAEHLPVAVTRMIAILREKDRDNPYVSLYEAVLHAAENLRVQA